MITKIWVYTTEKHLLNPGDIVGDSNKKLGTHNIISNAVHHHLLWVITKNWVHTTTQLLGHYVQLLVQLLIQIVDHKKPGIHNLTKSGHTHIYSYENYHNRKSS